MIPDRWRDDKVGKGDWQIDAEGRIFYGNEFVAQIERAPENDGHCSTGFRIMGVTVKKDGRYGWQSVFDSRISGTSARVRLTEDEYAAILIDHAEQVA